MVKSKKTKKLVENIDDSTWIMFTGYCKIKQKKVGDLLSEVLEEYLKDKIK